MKTFEPGGGRIYAAIAMVSAVLFCILLVRSVPDGPSSAGSLPAPLVVEVKGDVPKPGVYLLEKATATVSGALGAAGWSGAVPEGAAGRELVSGEAVRALGRGGSARIEIGRMEGASLLAAGLKLDLNSAPFEDLLLVARMRPEIAASIVRRREKTSWKNVEELTELRGVGRKTVEKLGEYLCAMPRGEGTTVWGREFSGAPEMAAKSVAAGPPEERRRTGREKYFGSYRRMPRSPGRRAVPTLPPKPPRERSEKEESFPEARP